LISFAQEEKGNKIPFFVPFQFNAVVIY
jgi:hypothetical protein